MLAIDSLYEGGYNTIYDRAYDRVFDSSAIDRYIGTELAYRPMHTGLEQCLENFLNGDRQFLQIDWKYEAYQDFLTGDCAAAEEFDSEESYLSYLSLREHPACNHLELRHDRLLRQDLRL